MKIAFAVPAYWPSIIGVSLYCQELAEGLVKKGHKVTVYTGINPGWAPEEKRNGVDIKRLERKYLTKAFYTMPSMADSIIQDKPDIVHSHHYGYYEATAGLEAAQKLGVPHLFGPYYHPPVYSLFRRIAQGFYHRKYGKALLSQSDIVLPHTEFEKALLLEIGGSEETMRILPNTVNTKVFKPSGKRQKTVLFVSNLTTEKGAGIALDLAEEITKDRKDMKFIFKGKHADNRLTDKIDYMKSNPNVKFMQEDLSSKDLAKLYSQASVLLLPSKYEAFSKVLAEGQACGTPAVATKVGGIPEVVLDGKSGYLVEYGNWEEMKQKILFLLDNSKIAAKMGAAGRKHVVQNFDTQKIVARLEAIYKELMKR